MTLKFGYTAHVPKLHSTPNRFNTINNRKAIPSINENERRPNTYPISRSGFLNSLESSCQDFFTYINSYNGVYGVVKIPDPEIPKSSVELVLTVAANVNSVSLSCINYYLLEHIRSLNCLLIS